VRGVGAGRVKLSGVVGAHFPTSVDFGGGAAIGAPSAVECHRRRSYIVVNNSALNKHVAKRFPTDIDVYTAGKTEFITSVLVRFGCSLAATHITFTNSA
jgi:hypothetical protein